MRSDIGSPTVIAGFLLLGVILAFLVGVEANKRRQSFWAAFFLSLLITPLVAYLIVVLIGWKGSDH